MSQILIETRLNSLKLNESKSPRKGCLGRIEGVCADYGNPTRNGRLYSRDLWEHVFNDDLVKESLESKTLIGELDHPEDRFEPLAKEACVVMTDYKFDDDKQVVYGGFDILDTPAGRILKSLLDYGCVMGVSSRGQGDIINGAEYEEVAPDSYEFACFDVVTTPAVAIARQHVTESVGKQKIKSLSDSIIEQVNNSKTNEELDTILRVIESTEIPNLKVIKKAIKDKRKSIVEGKTISDKTKKDLHEARIEINRLSKELEKQSIKTIEEAKNFNATISNLTSQVLAYKHREQRLVSATEALRKKLGERDAIISESNKKLVESNKSNRLKTSKLNVNIDNLNSENAELRSKLDEKQLTLEKTQKHVDYLKKKLDESTKTSSCLQSQLDEQSLKIKELSESLESEKSKNDSEVKSLSESIRKSDKILSEKDKSLTSFKESYTSIICEKYNLDKSTIVEALGNDYSVEKLDAFARECQDKRDRYSKLPFSSSNPKGIKILSENLKQANFDEEYEASKRFIEAASGINN